MSSKAKHIPPSKTLTPQQAQSSSKVKKPSSSDVVFGFRTSEKNRGTVGNSMYRGWIDTYAVTYKNSGREERSKIAQSIVARIRSLGGQFLEKDRSSGLWFDVGDKRSLEKTARALRERNPALSKQSKVMIEKNTRRNVDCNLKSNIFSTSESKEVSHSKIASLIHKVDVHQFNKKRSDVKSTQSTLEYMQELQLHRHLYTDERNFLEEIFGSSPKADGNHNPDNRKHNQNDSSSSKVNLPIQDKLTIPNTLKVGESSLKDIDIMSDKDLIAPKLVLFRSKEELIRLYSKSNARKATAQDFSAEKNELLSQIQ